MNDSDLADYYGMFKYNHPIGRFNVEDVVRFTPTTIDNATKVVKWALENKKIHKATGEDREYFHMERPIRGYYGKIYR